MNCYKNSTILGGEICDRVLEFSWARKFWTQLKSKVIQMQQSPQSLNPWLVSYIEQQRSKQSRYEIDKYLIGAGNDPAEIELVWQSFEPPPPIKTISYFRKHQKEIILVVVAILFMYVIPSLLRAYFPSFDQDSWFIPAIIMAIVVTLGIGLKIKNYRIVWLALWVLGLLVVLFLIPLDSKIKTPFLILGNLGTVIVAGIYDGKHKQG